MTPFLDAVLARAAGFVGTKETEPNAGPHINAWLALVDQPPGKSWCAAFLYAMFLAETLERGMAPEACPFPRSAGALNVLRRAPTSRCRMYPGRGLVYVLDHGEGLGHVGIIEAVRGELVTDISGNTNGEGGRQGDQVARHDWRPADGKRGTLVGYLDFDVG